MPFIKGKSGNPAGRPYGSSPAQKLARAIEADVPEIVAMLVRAAKDGDVGAAKILIDRVYPPLKSTLLPVHIHSPQPVPVADRAEVILDAATSGLISADTAVMLINAVATAARLSAETAGPSSDTGVRVYLPEQDSIPE